MIQNASEVKACYKALQKIDEVEATLRKAIKIMTAMSTHDVYQALSRLEARSEEIYLAIRKYQGDDSLDLDFIESIGSVEYFLEAHRESKLARSEAAYHRRARRMLAPSDRFKTNCDDCDSEHGDPCSLHR
jgi:hypothetical protein